MTKQELKKIEDIRQELARIVEMACFAVKDLNELCGEEE